MKKFGSVRKLMTEGQSKRKAKINIIFLLIVASVAIYGTYSIQSEYSGLWVYPLILLICSWICVLQLFGGLSAQESKINRIFIYIFASVALYGTCFIGSEYIGLWAYPLIALTGLWVCILTLLN